MSLPFTKPPMGDVFLAEGTTSVATTPVSAAIVSPVTGILRKVFAAALGATTTVTTVAVSINGGADVSGGLLTIPVGAGGNNPGLELAKVGINTIMVNEGDTIEFTPSGGTGAAIPGAFSAAIRPQ
jgi:hypothetical protein